MYININILSFDKILEMSSEYIIERRRGGVLLAKKYVTKDSNLFQCSLDLFTKVVIILKSNI